MKLVFGELIPQRIWKYRHNDDKDLNTDQKIAEESKEYDCQLVSRPKNH